MDCKREVSPHFLGEFLEIFPNSLQELQAQCTRRGIEEFPQVQALLSDKTLSSGLHRDWRKAVFRLLDCLFTRFGLPLPQSHNRLDLKLFPFMSYYLPSILVGIAEDEPGETGENAVSKKEQANLLLEEILRDNEERQVWSLLEVLTRCQPSYIDLEVIYLKLSALITGAQKTKWMEFSSCLRIADRYDMTRKVYQALDQEEIWDKILSPHFSKEERGDILDLWQATIDSRVGEYSKLKRALFKVVKETCTLPNSMVLRGIRLVSSDVVHGGGCADIYKGVLGDILTALKVLRIFNKDEMKAVFRELCKEAIVWRQLRHENIAPFLGLCNESELFRDRVALVSPWMSNGDLSSYLQRNPDADRVSFAVQVATGMKFLHDQDPQVIHGDLRANNVLVDDKIIARITDFGISSVNVVQTKLSVQSNRGSARWQAPELHYRDEALSHVTTKSDVYAFGMTCYEIFTDALPFAHLRSDGMVIMELLNNRTKPERPNDLAIERRGLTDRLWNLLEDCWDFDPQERLPMANVLAVLQNEARFIAKERERRSKLAENTTTIEVDNSKTQTEDDALSTADLPPVNDAIILQHSPIRAPIDLRFDESTQHYATVRPSPAPIQGNVDPADSQAKYLPRGRPNPIIIQDCEEVEKESGMNVDASAPPPLKDRSLSDSSASSAQSVFSRASEQTVSTNMTSPNGSPVQEKKNSYDLRLVPDEQQNLAAEDNGHLVVDAQANLSQTLREDIAGTSSTRRQSRSSFNGTAPKPTTVVKPEFTGRNNSLPKALDDELAPFLRSSPESTGNQTGESPSTQVRTLSTSSAPNGPSSSLVLPSDFPRLTDSPPPFKDKDASSKIHASVRVQNADESEPNFMALEAQEMADNAEYTSQEKGADRTRTTWPQSWGTETMIPNSAKTSQARVAESKLRNRMGAVKLAGVGFPDEDHVLPSLITEVSPKDEDVKNEASGLDKESEEDAWGLDSASPLVMPEKAEVEEIDEFNMFDPLQHKSEREHLLKYSAPAGTDQGRHAPDADVDETIETDVQDFFDKRDLDKAREYFIGTSAVHRYKLIAGLIMYALNSDIDENIDALLLAELLDKSVESGWCSASDYEKAVLSVMESLNSSSSVLDVKTVAVRLDIILGGMELPETMKSSTLRCLREAGEKPNGLVNNIRDAFSLTNASTDGYAMSPKVNKVKIE